MSEEVTRNSKVSQISGIFGTIKRRNLDFYTGQKRIALLLILITFGIN